MTTATTESAGPLPLQGIKVVQICHSLAGPYAGSILAELGAEVIKVEQPVKGDDARAWGTITAKYWSVEQTGTRVT